MTTRLTDSIPIMTAWVNDTSYESIFVEQLRCLMDKNDVVIGISGSGNSPNVLRAMEFTTSHGAETVALTGFQGGVSGIAKHTVIVPSNSMQVIEDVHSILRTP